ncbi:DUF6932 family protein [Gloeothece verrucosa]|uniref:Uncharacterized protein n=1 Tax=Gloeothece verrucosa (strain PCC 7822) TaxID=497965 RepID=E0UGG4_GLOV7|nr:hypothetical protein [Gloeothece verrucosa]ADN12059.1 conserved hypothetical protein [Gloeothece verrucosa PCC 7822]
MSIPSFQSNGNLPEGIHLATWQEVENTLGFNERRKELLAGLKRACESLKLAGCKRIYIDGSFATSKEYPGDFDGCWQDDTVDFIYLKSIDPVLLDFTNKRAMQKAKYGGELFPASYQADIYGKTFVEFFQEDRNGNAKGIIAIDL